MTVIEEKKIGFFFFEKVEIENGNKSQKKRKLVKIEKGNKTQ